MIAIDKKGWKKVKFGDVCRNLNVTIKSPLHDDLYRVIGLEHIIPGNLHIESWNDISEGTTFTKTFKAGHVLFGKRRAYQKKAAFAEFSGLCSGDILVFEAIEEKLNPRLLPFIVSSDSFFDYAVKTSAGSLSPRTKFQDLAMFEFLLPPMDQQEKLAELLWAGESVLVNLKNLIHQQNVLLKRLIKDIQIRNISFGKMKLKEILQFEYGSPLKEQDRISGAHPVVGSAGVVGTHTISNCKGPGIVVGRKGGAGLVHFFEEDFFVIDTAYFIINKTTNWAMKFLYYLLQALDLPSLSITTAVPGLNRNDAHEQTIFEFTTDEQFSILSKFERLETSISKSKLALQSAKNVRQNLIESIFRK
jgi:type I restriction enzyme S subunit